MMTLLARNDPAELLCGGFGVLVTYAITAYLDVCAFAVAAAALRFAANTHSRRRCRALAAAHRLDHLRADDAEAVYNPFTVLFNVPVFGFFLLGLDSPHDDFLSMTLVVASAALPATWVAAVVMYVAALAVRRDVPR